MSTLIQTDNREEIVNSDLGDHLLSLEIINKASSDSIQDLIPST